MRKGRIGPLSWQAHRRMVCGARFRWNAASAVVKLTRVSCDRGVGWIVFAAMFKPFGLLNMVAYSRHTIGRQVPAVSLPIIF